MLRLLCILLFIFIPFSVCFANDNTYSCNDANESKQYNLYIHEPLIGNSNAIFWNIGTPNRKRSFRIIENNEMSIVGVEEPISEISYKIIVDKITGLTMMETEASPRIYQILTDYCRGDISEDQCFAKIGDTDMMFILCYNPKVRLCKMTPGDRSFPTEHYLCTKVNPAIE